MVQERFRKKNIAIDELQGQQRKKRLRRRIFYLALILLISAAFFAVCVLVFFNVGEIELVGLERCDAAAVREALGVSVGDNMFSFRAGDVESALKKAFPYIASAEVSRGFPTKLTVTVGGGKARRLRRAVRRVFCSFARPEGARAPDGQAGGAAVPLYESDGRLYRRPDRRVRRPARGEYHSFGCWTPWTAAAFWIKSFRSI